MIVNCSSCNTSFNLSDELVKEEGTKVKCSKCNHLFKIFPSYIQAEYDAQQNDQQESENKLKTEFYSSPHQALNPKEEFIQKQGLEIDLDFSGIEKVLQEENSDTEDRDTLETGQGDEDIDDFEFSDLDYLFEKEEKIDFFKFEDTEDAEGIEELEEIDLSELDDLFQDDETQSLQASVAKQDEDFLPEGIDSSDDRKELVGDSEVSVNEELKLDFKDPEKMEETLEFDEEFDLSDLEDIIDFEEKAGDSREDVESKYEDEDQEFDFDLALEPDVGEGKSLELVLEEEEPAFDISEKAIEFESDFSEKNEETPFKLNLAETDIETGSTEKQDYNSDETERESFKNPEAMALTNSMFKDSTDDYRGRKFKRAKPKSRIGKWVLAGFVLLLLTGAGYGLLNFLKTTGFQIPFIGNNMKTETADVSGNLNMIILDLNSKFEENQHDGKIFIITGTIKNEYPEARSFIKLTGKLYDTAKKLSKSEQVYAGNVFSELELRSLDMETIKSGLSNRAGQNESNVNIEPGQSVPFMIVFFMLPQQLEEFTVEIDSSTPA